jgi:signal transduction histidine kinase
MKAVSLAASLFVMCIGALVLTGWALDIVTLKTVLPGLVAMKANTAVGLLLSGLGVSLASWKEPGTTMRLLISAIAAVVIALGAATLGEYFFGWNPGIDQWLFRDASTTVWTSQPGRMAPVSAFCFVLVGGALVAASYPIPARLRLPILSGLGVALAVMGGLALAGCVAEGWLHALSWNNSGLAIHTALAFLLLGCALLALAIGQGGLTWWLDAIVTVGFVMALAIMLLTAGVSYNFTNRLFQTANLVGHTQEVLRVIEKASAAATSLESGPRGYVITGDEKLLAERGQMKAGVYRDLAELRTLTADDPAQLRRLDQLEDLIGKRFEFWDQTIATRRRQGFDAAQKMIDTGASVQVSAERRRLFQAMQDDEYAALDDEQKRSREASTSTFLVLPLGVFLSLTISSLGLFLLNAGVGERVSLEKAWRRSEERFQTVIENLTEGLVIARLDGHLLHWNPAALAMHGFKSVEQWRLGVSEFFRIFELSTLDGAVLPLDQWPISRVIRGERLRDFPVRIRRLDLDWERVFNYAGSIVREPSGEQLVFLAISDITERRRTEQIQLDNLRLEEENRRFAEASRLKNEFLANISHELRTPLNGIIGFTELLADEKPGPVNRKQQEYLGTVLTSARHLLQLINDVLDLAKVEAGKFEFKAESFRLRESIDEVCAVLRGMANKKKVLLRSETAPELGFVTLDEHRFKQVCYNLLSNAVKFTDTGGSVDIIAVERDAATFEVRVTDTGIGIRRESMDRLFRQFEQLESGASRRFEGTGLGLALSKKLVEMQGGSIAVRSEYGKGSTFTVVLPKEANPA